MNRVSWGIIIVVVVAAVAVTGAVLGGFLFVAGKSPTSIGAVYTPVCRGERVDAYIRDFTSVPMLTRQEVIKEHQQAIGKLANWEEDASCVYMMLQFASATRNVDETNRLFERYEQLSAQGLHPDIRLAYAGVNVKAVRESATKPAFDPATAAGGV